MGQIDVNIEALERRDKIEKIVVITLLLLSILFTAFVMLNKEPSTTVKAKKDPVEPKEATAATNNDQSGNTAEGSTDSKIISDEENSSNQPVTEAEEAKMGLLAVGLFANADNAERMKNKLNEMGFEGHTKVRADGKTIVGVRTAEDNQEMFSQIMTHFSDAVFIAD